MNDTITHHCPNCGGPLTFNPEDQKFHCDYCLSIFTIEAIDAEDESAIVENNIEETNENELFLCPSCGAQIVTDTTTAATYCYFCHNPVVLQGRLSGEFLPNKVLPFKIDRKKAEADFLAWVKKKKFVPKDFYDTQQIEKMTGVYFPYWVVDAKTQGDYHGKGTAVRVWIVGDLEYTETKIYDVYRKGKAKINDLVKNALSKNIQQKMVNQVQPFPINNAVDFKTEYLSGFQAEKRDIEMRDLSADVSRELNEYTDNLMRDTITSYTTFNKKSSSIAIDEQNNHYMLLPVWLVTYHDKNGKVYYYAMNGQTGKTSGILPISYSKLGLTSAGIFAIVAALLMIVGYFI